MKKRVRLLYFLLVSVMILGLAACGKNKNANGGAAQQKEYIWVPQFLQVSEESLGYSPMQVKGDILYYLKSDWDPETYQSKYVLKGISLADASEKVSAAFETDTPGDGDGSNSDRSIQHFCIDNDGNIVAVAQVYHWSESGSDSTEFYLCKYDQAGKKLAEKECTKEFAENEYSSYVRNMAIDAQGRVYVVVDKAIHLFDAEFAYRGKVEIGADAYIQGAGLDRDGVMCAVVSEYGAGEHGTTLREIDFDKKGFGQSYANYPNNYMECFVAGVEKSTLTSDGSKVYEYDKSSQSAEELLDWLDSDINGETVNYMSVLEDGRILTVTRDWGGGETEVALLEKKKSSEVQQRTTITIASLYQNQGVQSAAVKFNKSNDQYRVSIRTYFDYNNVENDKYDEAVSDATKRMLSDITSKNCPDLIDLSEVNTEQLAAKGVFEDLNAYMEKSEKVRRDDYIESILECYTYNDTLVAVPRSFELMTVAGKTAEVGKEPGWTLDEMLAYADRYPDAAIFDYSAKVDILQFLLAYNQGAFVDWKTGKCSFDTDTFKNLLRFANKFPDEYDWQSEDNRSTPTKIADGDVLMNRVYIYNFNSIQEAEGVFGEPVTFIGYPNDEGNSGCYLMTNGLLAMASKSKNKEGAWEFLESYLTAESNWNDFGLPARKADLQTQRENATKVEYALDENGDKILDSDGNPIIQGGGGSVGYEDGWTYEYHVTTEEEADRLIHLIEIARPVSDSDSQIMNIISEEAQAFFKGDKSADDVAGVVQSRVQLYVNENR